MTFALEGGKDPPFGLQPGFREEEELMRQEKEGRGMEGFFRRPQNVGRFRAPSFDSCCVLVRFVLE